MEAKVFDETPELINYPKDEWRFRVRKLELKYYEESQEQINDTVEVFCSLNDVYAFTRFKLREGEKKYDLAQFYREGEWMLVCSKPKDIVVEFRRKYENSMYGDKGHVERDLGQLTFWFELEMLGWAEKGRYREEQSRASDNTAE